jgi:uncharacterized protein
MKRNASRLWYAAVATVVFTFADNINYLTRPLRRFIEPLAELGARNLLQVGLCIFGVSLAHRFGFRPSLRELGMRAPVGRGLTFAFIASLPMLIAFALTSTANPKMTWMSVGVGCFIAPFAEEVLFRSYMFRQLYRRARLGFWLSALIPSVIFALGHLYQSSEPAELAGILAITGLGSLLTCWIFLRWQDNLWAIFGLHSLMNLWWEVFAVDDTALGGWLANAARLATIGLAILLTIYKDRIWKPLTVEVDNVRETGPSEQKPNGAGVEMASMTSPVPA